MPVYLHQLAGVLHKKLPFFLLQFSLPKLCSLQVNHVLHRSVLRHLVRPFFRGVSVLVAFAGVGLDGIGIGHFLGPVHNSHAGDHILICDELIPLQIAVYAHAKYLQQVSHEFLCRVCWQEAIETEVVVVRSSCGVNNHIVVGTQ